MQECIVRSHARVVDCEGGVFCRHCARKALTDEDLSFSDPECEQATINAIQALIVRVSKNCDHPHASSQKEKDRVARFCAEGHALIVDLENAIFRRTGEPRCTQHPGYKGGGS